MSIHHCPRVMSFRYGAWADCLCGWTSREVRNRAAASVLWAEHVATSSGAVASDHRPSTAPATTEGGVIPMSGVAWK